MRQIKGSSSTGIFVLCVVVLFLQQFVDVLDVIQAVIDEETQFGNNTQLIAYACTQVVANGFLVCSDVLDDFLRFFLW